MLHQHRSKYFFASLFFGGVVLFAMTGFLGELFFQKSSDSALVPIVSAAKLERPVLSPAYFSCDNGVPRVQLSWTSVSNGTTYTVSKNSPNITGWPQITRNVLVTSYTDTVFAAGPGVYAYQVKAVDSLKRVSYSAIQSVLISPCVTTTTVSTSTPPIQPPVITKVDWGAYVGWGVNDMATFEEQVKSNAKYQATFVHWGNENLFPLYLTDTVKNKGKTLIIFWEATDYNVTSPEQPRFSYSAILRGDWNAYATRFASDARAYGGPVIIVPFSEMNGDWSPWSVTKNGNTPAQHIAAYRHLRSFFQDTPNVSFGWAPNNDSVPDVPDNQFERYYPGSEYVDIVGVDGFNFGSPWQSFDSLFNSSLTRLKIYQKPIFLFSFASAPGLQKATWITDALTVQIPKYPEIRAWVWFNENKERDWRVWSDPASLEAFKSAVSK